MHIAHGGRMCGVCVCLSDYRKYEQKKKYGRKFEYPDGAHGAACQGTAIRANWFLLRACFCCCPRRPCHVPIWANIQIELNERTPSVCWPPQSTVGRCIWRWMAELIHTAAIIATRMQFTLALFSAIHVQHTHHTTNTSCLHMSFGRTASPIITRNNNGPKRKLYRFFPCHRILLLPSFLPIIHLGTHFHMHIFVA